MRKTYLIFLFFLSLLTSAKGQVLTPEVGQRYFLVHRGGEVVGLSSDEAAPFPILNEAESFLSPQFEFVPMGNGYYRLNLHDSPYCLAFSDKEEVVFSESGLDDASLFSIERVSPLFVRLRCKSGNRYLSSRDYVVGSHLHVTKKRNDKGLWYFTPALGDAVESDSVLLCINPMARRQVLAGWGVSLCWWAHMCGQWSEDKVDELVDWLVSPDGLNYNVFRYNIGGGDDPLHRNCKEHHMAEGKGIRAEMEGFKVDEDSAYDWTRDAGQRRLMLKIKEKRPDAIFEAFSNSPPYYMTYSGCCGGNVNPNKDNLRPEYYEAFAQYLVDVCAHYKEVYDIEFHTLEPFNEPVTNYWNAGGSQEGCHFDVESMIAFVKVLHPILKKSGLSTLISVTDETSVEQSVVDYDAFRKDEAAFSAVGQWNAHSYSADRKSRVRLKQLASSDGMPLWMSEVGGGGRGIRGNLSVAQKQFDDLRYMAPVVWTDWQYVEEGNDQWCMVRGVFSTAEYVRVKNYYVRQQVTRFISQGYQFLSVLNEQTLAALSPDGESLVVVILNNERIAKEYLVDLSLFKEVDGRALRYRTDREADCKPIDDVIIQERTLRCRIAPGSIETLLVKVKI